MTFFYVIQNTNHGKIIFVENIAMGQCIFTSYESRAKLFNEKDANELINYLSNAKPKNHYAKISTQTTTNDQTIRSKE